jgi:hypothetical protein
MFNLGPGHGDDVMDEMEAVAAAKKFVNEIYADEKVTNLGLEEIEYMATRGNWVVTLGFSRPWNTPRTRAQEVLENLGAVSSPRRSYKVVTIAEDGTILSMKNRAKEDVSE